MNLRILVPLDGSKLAEQVLPHVGSLAKAFSSRVILVNVCESEETKGGQACSLYMYSEADRLKEMIGPSKARVETEIIVGTAAKETLNYAEKADIDLIVMSSHGRSGLMLLPMGSTVDKVLRKVDVPLIIVRANAAPAPLETGLFTRILIPLDGSERGEAVLPYAAEITRKLESEVILLRVVEAGKHVHTIGGLDYIAYKYEDIQLMKSKAAEYLAQASARFAGTKARVNREVLPGDAAKEIIQFAMDRECSLIALTSHVHSRLEAWSMGSVTYKILKASSKSVLFVPALER